MLWRFFDFVLFLREAMVASSWHAWRQRSPDDIPLSQQHDYAPDDLSAPWYPYHGEGYWHCRLCKAWVTTDHMNKSQHQNAVVSAFQRTWYPIPAGYAALPNPYAVRTGGKDGKDNGKGGGGHNDKGGGKDGKDNGKHNGKGGGIGERVALMEEQVTQQGANIRDIQENLVLVLQVPETITRSPRFLDYSTLIPPTAFSLSEDVDATPIASFSQEYALDLRVLHGSYEVPPQESL